MTWISTDPDTGEAFALPQYRKPLSGRQLLALEMAADGATNGEIGRRMGISEETAARHLAVAYGKLCATGRAGAVAAGFRLGWLT